MRRRNTITAGEAANLLGISTSLFYYRARHGWIRPWRRLPVRVRVVDVMNDFARPSVKNPRRRGRQPLLAQLTKEIRLTVQRYAQFRPERAAEVRQTALAGGPVGPREPR